MRVLVDLVVMLGMAVVVPVGLRLLDCPQWILGAWMAGTHRVANAVGFGLCSVLAWRRVKERAW